MSNKSNNKPEVIRSKNISLSIFSNTNKDNKEFKTYKLQRSFKRDDNSNWEHSDTFGERDLPKIIALLQKAQAEQITTQAA